jgi:hypothetical protein
MEEGCAKLKVEVDKCQPLHSAKVKASVKK